VTNSSYSTDITSCRLEKYYSFTPSYNSTYRFESSGDLDTRIFIYNSSGSKLASDDDGTGYRNFRLDYNFTSGTKYYIEVDLYSYGRSRSAVEEISEEAVEEVSEEVVEEVVEEVIEEEVFEEIVEEEIYEEIVEEVIEEVFYGTINFTVKRLYTITYNANGGSDAPSSQTKIHGTTLTLSSTVPTKTGSTFLGWSTSSSATSATYSKNGSFTTNANTTLYAVWDANEYTITYNANGGSGAPSSQTKTYGTNLTLSSTVPTRFGYTFLGWSASSSATSATYVPGGSFTTDATTTLYAVWQSATIISSSVTNSSYSASISFGSGYKFYSFTPSTGGTYRFESSGSLDTQIYLYNSSGTQLTWDDDDGDRTNFLLDYNFTSGTQYYIKVKCYSSYTGTINFTVKRLYTISYNANGGSGTPSSQTKTHGANLTLSSTVPTRIGYTFLGWSTNSGATSADYQAGTTYTGNANVTLYAVWRCQGLVYICDSTGEFCPYQIFIYDGSNWNQYAPYIYNGSSWELYS
jgi:uncharacterized repeat protein (TIGR02543 family)